MAATVLAKNKRDFDQKKFLATIGEGRKVVAFPKKQTIFAQGDAADSVFYIQGGKVRLTVVSEIGKEATLGILSEGEFCGEGVLAGQPLLQGGGTLWTSRCAACINQQQSELPHSANQLSDLCSLDQWDHSSQGYAVSIEPMNSRGEGDLLASWKRKHL